MAKNFKTIKSEYYDRVQEAKRNVEVLRRFYDKPMTPLELLDSIHDKFDSDERIVITAGYFTANEDGTFYFKIPTTARVLKYMNDSNFAKFELGFTKIIVKEMATLSNNHEYVRSDTYIWLPEELREKPDELQEKEEE